MVDAELDHGIRLMLCVVWDLWTVAIVAYIESTLTSFYLPLACLLRRRLL